MDKTEAQKATIAAGPDQVMDGSTRPRPKFEVYGEEMLEKEVKRCGNSGRIYLPQEWVGKSIKVIRYD